MFVCLLKQERIQTPDRHKFSSESKAIKEVLEVLGKREWSTESCVSTMICKSDSYIHIKEKLFLKFYATYTHKLCASTSLPSVQTN